MLFSKALYGEFLTLTLDWPILGLRAVERSVRSMNMFLELAAAMGVVTIVLIGFTFTRKRFPLVLSIFTAISGVAAIVLAGLSAIHK